MSECLSEFLALWDRPNFADNARSYRQIRVIFLRTGCLTSNKPFVFGADPDHDPDPGIFNGNITIAGYRGNCKICLAFAEVCTLRVLYCISLPSSVSYIAVLSQYPTSFI